ncbi:hypothetical protein [Pseudosulfitobacter sp. SM2401]|uniref:hypothetical protein n=1 Tax=Pseudosulfitobacter sp. SM2401 TaxID=3350098 RepID=UPI0036F3F7B5
MFKQLFEKFAATKPNETQRETITRALAEVNEVVSGLSVKPMITIDPETGAIELALPDQMPDEALALPAPTDVIEEKADAA